MISPDEIKKKFRVEIDEQNQFDQLLKDAFDKPWWRKVVDAFKARRAGMLEMLCQGGMEKHDEDILRGQIREDSLIIFLDERARLLTEQKEQATESENDGADG